MTKQIMILVLMIFIALSCNSVKQRIICGEIEAANTRPKIFCDVSIQFQRCRCRCFDLESFSTVDDKLCGDDFKSGNKDIYFCEGIAGFFNKDWAVEVKPKLKRLEDLKGDYCGQ